jgi:hypothetical protein
VARDAAAGGREEEAAGRGGGEARARKQRVCTVSPAPRPAR